MKESIICKFHIRCKERTYVQYDSSRLCGGENQWSRTAAYIFASDNSRSRLKAVKYFLKFMYVFHRLMQWNGKTERESFVGVSV